ncbi:MAG: L-threonate dehydrogenase, partial [Pseudomonadota bacterium]
SLLRAGWQVYGFDMVEANVDRLVAEGGARAELADAVSQSSVVIVVVLNAAQLEEVLFGDASIVSDMQDGSCVLAFPTVPPWVAIDLESRCNAQGVLYLDAPISGGAAKAAEGQLTIMAAGSPHAFAAAEPALEAVAEEVFRLGDQAGPGSAIKAVNQLLAGIHISAMAEALTFGMTQGIAPETLLDVIPKCAGTSWMFENRGPKVATGDYQANSAVNIWPKDLGIVLDIAREAKFSAPLTAAALQQFIAAAGSGLGHEDDSAVAKVYARNAGITLPES